jgi:AraC family transcriptional regulator
MAGMPRASEPPLTFHPLFESSVVTIRDYDCRHRHGGPATEECSTSNDIVLMRHGVFCQHFGSRTVTADLNHAVFFSNGSTYRISHPADCGDRGTVFTVNPAVLREIVSCFNPSADDRPENPFPFVTNPCDAKIFWQHNEFLERLQATETDPLGDEITAINLIADILEAAYTHHARPRKRWRSSTESDHADRIETAKRYLASRMGQRVTLDEAARAAHMSPYHFSRVFHDHTGSPVHRYLNRLRLRASLQHLPDSAGDLTSLALQLGFSSQSHFGEVFRREFGCTPATFRRRANRRVVGEMSRNLRV